MSLWNAPNQVQFINALISNGNGNSKLGLGFPKGGHSGHSPVQTISNLVKCAQVPAAATDK